MVIGDDVSERPRFGSESPERSGRDCDHDCKESFMRYVRRTTTSRAAPLVVKSIIVLAILDTLLASASRIVFHYAIVSRVEETSKAAETSYRDLSPEIHKLKVALKRCTKEEIVKVQTIGPGGGKISLPGTTVTIPAKALHKKTKIRITMSSRPADLPAGMAVITPILGCQSSISFNEPVTIQMRTYCRSVGNHKTPVDIMHKRTMHDSWDILPNVSLTLAKQNYVTFQVWHFSKYIAVLSNVVSALSNDVTFELFNDVYIQQGSGMMASVFSRFKDCRIIEKDMKGRGYRPILPRAYQFSVKMEQKVTTSLECIEPNGITVKLSSSRPSSFILDEEFLTSGDYFVMYRVEPKPKHKVDLEFKCEVTIRKRSMCLIWRQIGKKFDFESRVPWPILPENHQTYEDNSVTGGLINMSGTAHHDMNNANLIVMRKQHNCKRKRKTKAENTKTPKPNIQDRF